MFGVEEKDWIRYIETLDISISKIDGDIRYRK